MRRKHKLRYEVTGFTDIWWVQRIGRWLKRDDIPQGYACSSHKSCWTSRAALRHVKAIRTLDAKCEIVVIRYWRHKGTGMMQEFRLR